MSLTENRINRINQEAFCDKDKQKSIIHFGLLDNSIYNVYSSNLVIAIKNWVVYYGDFGLVSIIITIISISNSLKSKKEVSLIERKIKKAQKLMKKTGDASIIYKALYEEVLPALVLNQIINKNHRLREILSFIVFDVKSWK